MLYCFVGFMGFFLLPSSPAFAAVVINEIFPKPSNETGEWIELYNNGPNPASLEGWKLENTAGDKKTYIIGSGIIVPVNRFWTFDQTQTAISLYNEGDTVKLFKPNSDGWDTADSQSYAGTLGVNTSTGRSSDGGGAWTICAAWSKNLPNNCPPPPTMAPTVIPTSPPAGGPTPRPTDTLPDTPPIPPATFIVSGNQSSPQVLGVASEKPISYADLKQFILRWTLGVVSLSIGIGALLILVISLYHKHKRRDE